ncbi:GGDEF domain-containing protein [Paenibacillus sp. MMS18-CY102]|uniref:GGDEF domain-containing protein n=1 Tax=Paenibacillus sp. MMS18-CY102 TaxID=2682849 RepID=UPI00136623F0|nr:GGDEF domain-containing protein [Paenibacillus sp. MMS18-CY102]MWC26835.1 diguanylate cyclase [Paenibacillus sp. MMS18-CY102]
MDLESLIEARERWNRRLLLGFWTFVTVSLLIELAYWAFTARFDILMPTALQLFIMLISHFSLKRMDKSLHDYVMIICSSLLASVYLFSYDTDYLCFLLLLPIVLTIYYLDTRKLFFGAITALLPLQLYYWAGTELFAFTAKPAHEQIGTTIIFAFVAFISWATIRRGQALIQYSTKIHLTNQDLLVKTVLMDKLIKTDALTELYNHITFHEYLEHLIVQHEANDLSLQLALIDIDNFKLVNDQYGHRAGDAILRRVSEIIRTVSGANDVAARYGGEEFAILLTDKMPEQSLALLEKLRVKIAAETHDLLDGKKVTISIGFSRYRPWEGKEVFFARTDEALYMAKKSGKNRIVLADDIDPQSGNAESASTSA